MLYACHPSQGLSWMASSRPLRTLIMGVLFIIITFPWFHLPENWDLERRPMAVQLVRSRLQVKTVQFTPGLVFWHSLLFPPSYAQEAQPSSGSWRSMYSWNTRQMVPRTGLGVGEGSALTWDTWGGLLGRVQMSAGKGPSA